VVNREAIAGGWHTQRSADDDQKLLKKRLRYRDFPSFGSSCTFRFVTIWSKSSQVNNILFQHKTTVCIKFICINQKH